MEKRPDFNEIKSYGEFTKYYWYREELSAICKQLGIDHSGSKSELNYNIEQYFTGNIVQKKKSSKKQKVIADTLTLDTKLLECGFCFNQKFRDFFSEQTGISNFKFNTDMVATSKKVKQDNDTSFTLGDMLDIYYGKKEYAKYDNSSCQWNKFLKDFCADERNGIFRNKLKTAAILWKIVRESTLPKVYTYDLVEKYEDLLQND